MTAPVTRCSHCGEMFQPLTKRALYCTSNCQVNAARARRRERDKNRRLGREPEPEQSFEQFLEEQAAKTTQG